MDDLISRQAAIDALEKAKAKDPFNRYEKQNIGLDWGIEAIESLPSAEPEIIRCKECLMHGVCRFEQGLGLDGYCSQAKRRTDEIN